PRPTPSLENRGRDALPRVQADRQVGPTTAGGREKAREGARPTVSPKDSGPVPPLPPPGGGGPGGGGPSPRPPRGVPLAATFTNIEAGSPPAPSPGHKMSDRSTPLTPAEAAKTFTVPDDLEIEQVLAEPLVAQPVFITFDERGRMWVVEYRQYPAP